MRRVALFWLAGLLFASAPAVAAEGPLSVTLHLSGTAYKGSPAFELRADGKAVGGGSLQTPVPRDQVFTFELPQNADPKKIAVALINDSYKAGEGDRNLYVLSVAIGGVTYDGSKLTALPAPVSHLKGKVLQLWQNGEAVLDRPAAGWRADAANVAAAASSSTAPQPAAATCHADDVSILGFGNGSAAVPADGKAAIQAFVASLSGQACVFTVTGFTNATGVSALRMAAGRADAVAAEIVKLGVDKAKVSVEGGGATTQFGALSSDNRRVVISVKASAT